jgi:tripartite ATP-independent transporter DctP family solute receptor
MSGIRLWSMVIALVLVASTTQAAQILILGHNAPPGGPHSIGAKVFAEELERRLPGRFEIDEKGGVTLGAEPDLWDAVRLGTIDLALLTSISLTSQVPETGVLNIPFLFRDSAHAAKVLDGPVGHMLETKLAATGVVVLAWGELGFRNMTTSRRPIVVPADVAGLRMRIVPNPIYREVFQTLGAKPVQMFLPELYNALKEGRVDGEDNPLLVFQSNHLDDVQTYVSLTRMFYNPLIFMMNTDSFQALTPAEQEAVRAAAQAGAAATRQAVADQEDAAIRAFQEKGLAVIRTVDRAAFEKALASLQPGFDAMFGADLLRQIRETR